MAELCTVCGNKAGLLGRVKINVGYACGDCKNKSLFMSNFDCRSKQDFLDRFSYISANEELFNSFTPTAKVDGYLSIDENKKLFKFNTSRECFSFSSLVNFELNENGETLTSGGLGNAVVGGALFGGAGAIVGGVTGSKKSKTIIDSMYIRISLNDKWVKTHQIDLIILNTQKGGLTYNLTKTISDKIISMLELILNQGTIVTTPPTTLAPANSSADELLKFKQLLDMGAITNEEYSEKKKQLLGL